MNIYQSLLQKRTTWNAAPLAQESLNEEYGIADTIHRIIALALALELPVGEFTLAASKGELPAAEGVKEILEINSIDEETHYQGFFNAAQAYKVPQALIDEATQLGLLVIDHKDHTIVKSGWLELGIFFVTLPMLRKFGPVGAQLLSGNVSRDEARHVRTNFEIMDALGYTASPSLDKLRIDAIQWVTQNLTVPGNGAKYWRRQSDKLLVSRRAPDLEWTKRGQALAPFEIDNKNLSDYSA